MFKNFLLFVFDLVKIVTVSLVIIIPIRYFLIQPFYVKGASMEPNFYDKEYLIVDEISYRFKPLTRGDVIVFRYPRDPQEFFIKRLIGLPGESVQVRDGTVYIYNDANPDGFKLDETYLPEGLQTYGMTEEKIKLGDDEIFAMGDNRNASKDSRAFGPVNRSFLIGKVLLRGWPFDRMKLFTEAPTYTY